MVHLGGSTNIRIRATCGLTQARPRDIVEAVDGRCHETASILPSIYQETRVKLVQYPFWDFFRPFNGVLVGVFSTDYSIRRDSSNDLCHNNACRAIDHLWSLQSLPNPS